MEQDKITFKEGYHENDQLWYKLQYLNRNKHGEQLCYYENGELRYKHQYLNGLKHGEQLDYRSNGQLWFKTQYLNGKKVSYEEWIKYKRNSKLQSIWEKIKIK